MTKTMREANKIDWDIDIRYENDVLVAFDKFIEKWCGINSAHLLDTDEQDGQFMRDKITKLLRKNKQSNKKYQSQLQSVFEEIGVEIEMLRGREDNQISYYPLYKAMQRLEKKYLPVKDKK